MTSPRRTEGSLTTRIGWLDDLPLQLTSFVGRERELEEVEELLGETRLLTLTGSGGCGKTRLAMMAAERVADGFEDGVGWVWLAPVSDQTLVPRTVASALEARETPGLSPAEALVERIGDGEMLLVLDNCEHLIEACAGLVDLILRSCPRLKVLGTSRESLNVAGETAWSVPPLSRPVPETPSDPEELTRYEAVRLFVERAGLAAPGFQLTAENAAAVARICERLDGLPLAIELAAARVRVLSAEQISHRLDDALGLLTEGSRMAPSRQRTLRGALDWSHGLLPEAEQVLFRRLSVFFGGFALESAEKVCVGDGLAEEDVLLLLSRLVDKSLVLVTGREGEMRYRLLATVRQYAEEKLDSSGEGPEARRRHARVFLDLAERAEPDLTGAGQEWMDRLKTELGNLRAALGWSLSPSGTGDVELGLRLASALWWFWFLRGDYGEGRGWLEEALTRGGGVPTASRAKALTAAGDLAFLQSEYGRAKERLEEGLSLYRALGDTRGTANAIQLLGSMAREQGRYAEAEAFHGESLALWRGLGDDWGVAQSLNYLGFVAWLRGDPARATELCTQTLSTFRSLGDGEGTAWSLMNLGASALYLGDHHQATALLGEALELSRQAGYREGVAWSLNELGVAAHRQGDQERAEALLKEGLKVHHELGDRWRTTSLLEALAEVAGARGHFERAARLFGAAEALREDIGDPVPPAERVDLDRAGAAARAAMGAENFDLGLAVGRTMHAERAVVYALAYEPAPPETPAPLIHDLSAREVEVLGLVAEGLTDAQVAERLFLSPRTVGHHLRSVYRKLQVPSRAAAAKTALERGLI